MPVFKLQNDIIAFPPADFADSDGLLAEGGLVNAQWLMEAYKSGFYLWTHPMRYPKWWTPNPRIVLFPNELDVPQNLSEKIHNSGFTVTFNKDLKGVMKLIQSIENTGEMNNGWLTGKLIDAILEIDKLGFALSIEVYNKHGKLIGGAFGVRNKNIYFGEYINGIEKYAKEFALIELTKKLRNENFKLLDLQKETNETLNVGLTEISRSEYLRILKE